MRNSIYIFLFLTKSLISQNLVPNSGFENFHKVNESNQKTSKWVFLNLENWYPMVGSVDYYTDSLNLINYPHKLGTLLQTSKSRTGIVIPNSGKSCLGLLLGKEVVGCNLTKSLVKDSVYKISFYINWNIYSAKVSKNINFTFLDKRLKYDETITLEHIKNYKSNTVICNLGRDNSKRKEWVCLTFEYKAKGGEKYIYIGLQKEKYQNKRKKINKLPQRKTYKRYYFDGYYYIDDVCVTLKSDTVGCSYQINNINDSITFYNDSNVVTEENKELKIYVLEDLLYQLNSHELLTISKEVINIILPELKDLCNNDSIFIKIVGHTDNSGKEENNIKLSTNRAKSVMNYLVENGIPEQIIQIEGKGSSEPIANNKNEIGRSKNRRVEIIIYKKT